MATTRHTWYGIVVEFDNQETNRIISDLTKGAAATAFTGAIASMAAAAPVELSPQSPAHS